MAGRLCVFCGVNPILGRKRKYCHEHSAQASTIWKRLNRRQWRTAGDPYWLSDWKNKTVDERRHYFRHYMRRYRARKASRSLKEGDRDNQVQ